MGSTRHKGNYRFIMALFVLLAAPTNHSLGEVVYRKVNIVRVEDAEAQNCPAPTPETSPETPTETHDGLKVLKVQERDGLVKVLLDGGQNRGILPGTILQTERPLDQKQQLIPTALLKTIEVRETYTLAEVTANGSEDSLMHFPKYPGIMIGDYASPQNISIIQKTQLIPNTTFSYQQLFIDPKASPSTYEMTDEGRNILRERARLFAGIRAPLLIIEAHTDQHGDRDSNQLESYQRALTIRQVLIEELGLDPERIAAIGMGESEPLPEAYLPGREDEARRVVLKVKTPPQN